MSKNRRNDFLADDKVASLRFKGTVYPPPIST